MQNSTFLGKRALGPDYNANLGFVFNKQTPAPVRPPGFEASIDFLRSVNHQRQTKFDNVQFELRNSVEIGWFSYMNDQNNSSKKSHEGQDQLKGMDPLRSFERGAQHHSGAVLAPDVKEIRDSSNRLMSSFAKSCDYSD